jgi:hypothetical protein
MTQKFSAVAIIVALAIGAWLLFVDRQKPTITEEDKSVIQRQEDAVTPLSPAPVGKKGDKSVIQRQEDAVAPLSPAHRSVIQRQEDAVTPLSPAHRDAATKNESVGVLAPPSASALDGDMSEPPSRKKR